MVRTNKFFFFCRKSARAATVFYFSCKKGSKDVSFKPFFIVLSISAQRINRIEICRLYSRNHTGNAATHNGQQHRQQHGGNADRRRCSLVCSGGGDLLAAGNLAHALHTVGVGEDDDISGKIGRVCRTGSAPCSHVRQPEKPPLLQWSECCSWVFSPLQ